MPTAPAPSMSAADDRLIQQAEAFVLVANELLAQQRGFAPLDLARWMDAHRRTGAPQDIARRFENEVLDAPILTTDQAVALALRVEQPVAAPTVRLAAKLGRIKGASLSPHGEWVFSQWNFLQWLNGDKRRAPGAGRPPKDRRAANSHETSPV